MMDLQKVREALEIGLNAVIMAGQTRYQKDEADEIREAIAELDKPADRDAKECAIWVWNAVGLGASTDELSDKIQQYAEAYHARKLAEESAAILAASDRLGAALDA